MNDHDLIIASHISGYEGLLFVMLIDIKGELQGLEAIREDEERLLGRIYLGRVEKAVTGGAIINITKGLSCFLNISPDMDAPASGSLIPVRIIKEAHGSKLPLVSEKLSLSGRDVVVSDGAGSAGISKKLSSELRDGLRTFFNEKIAGEPFDLIIRSSAKGIPAEELWSECEELMNALSDIRQKAKTRTAGSLLYSKEERFFEVVRGFLPYMGDDGLRIVSDDEEVLSGLKEAAATVIKDDRSVECSLYADSDYPMELLYSMKSALESVTKGRVYLGSGIELVIDKTEALWAIDVNSSSYKKGSDFYSINLLAFSEILRQVRLRNMSGMILCDLINMSEEEKERFLKEAVRLAATDPVKLNVIDITKLGLLEMTRQRKDTDIYEKIIDSQ